MKFGFDIDDTLINLRQYAFHLYNEKLQKNIPLSVFHDIPTVEIHAPFGLTTEQGAAMWKSCMEEIYFKECPIFEGALETLQTLEQQGHEIYYITSRPKQYCAQTREWMIAQGFPVKDGHFFCGMKDDEKIANIKALQLDYYFDDKPTVLHTLQNVPTKIFVIDQSYNRTVDLPRLTHWSQFEQLIEK